MPSEAIPKPSEELLTPQQAAEILHVKVATLAVWRCHKRYRLRYQKIGSKVFYRPSEIERFIESRTVDSEPPPRKRRA